MREVPQYVTLIEGLTHFICTRLSANISTNLCATRYNRTKIHGLGHDKSFALCARCPIGEQHLAHEGDATKPEWKKIKVFISAGRDGGFCVRCGRSGGRMTSGDPTCVSCFNRLAEFKRGRNARGTVPKNFKPVVPRLLSVVGKKGGHEFVRVIGQTINESAVRATRAGKILHDQQRLPFDIAWNKDEQRFEYRQDGLAVLELEVDGKIEFIAVDKLHPGEVPAVPVLPILFMTADEASEMLEPESFHAEWRYAGVACSDCHRGVIQARSQDGSMLETRCTAC